MSLRGGAPISLMCGAELAKPPPPLASIVHTGNTPICFDAISSGVFHQQCALPSAVSHSSPPSLSVFALFPDDLSTQTALISIDVNSFNFNKTTTAHCSVILGVSTTSVFKTPGVSNKSRCDTADHTCSQHERLLCKLDSDSSSARVQPPDQ